MLIIIFILSLTLFGTVNAAIDSQQKRIGLVLSGGGIKGFGHLGTLHLIDSLNIPIDYIVGSSIGAISAALYASGHSSEEINKIAMETRWDEMFSQTRKRNKLQYFQKMDIDKYQLLFSMNGVKPIPPMSLTSGQYTYEYLLGLFQNYVNIQNYDNMVIPFRCNATDIISGNEIIFKSGSIAKSLRISSSIPTIFTPIEENNKLLIDGGIINNLPINIAQDLGANYIIASDVASKKNTKAEISDIFSIVQQIIDLYGGKNKTTNVLNADILINPQLQDISMINSSPKILGSIKEEGYKAAFSKIDDFLKLKTNKTTKLAGIPSDEFVLNEIFLNNDIADDIKIKKLFGENTKISKQLFIHKIGQIRNSNLYHNIHYHFSNYEQTPNYYDLHLYAIKNIPIVIKSIKINGNKKISSKRIIDMFTVKIGDTLNIKLFNDEISRAHETEYFHYINYDLKTINKNNSELIINVKENKNGTMKLGVIWDNHYKLIGKLKLDLMNKPIGNFRIQDELLFSGIKQNIFSLYYLVKRNNKINMIPFFRITNRIQEIGILDNNNGISYFNHDFKNYTYGLIIPLNKFGSLSLSSNKSESIYSITDNIKSTFTQVILDSDQLDDLSHPKNGYKMTVNYIYNIDNKKDYNYINFNVDYYKTYNFNHTIRFFSNYKKVNDTAPIHLQSYYGGFEWTSGYEEFSLSSNKLLFFGIEYQYHYKNSTTIRILLNKASQIKLNNSNVKTLPINYGFGIKIKSIVGPINFMWGRGYKDPFNSHSKKRNIFYFNFGMKL